MSRIIWAADNEVITPVFDLCATEPQQREVGLVTQ
jgi:hypothetical protein